MNLKAIVMQAATDYAAKFVEEFGEPFEEPSDWDATAWGEVCKELSLDDEAAERYWPVFQESFAEKTVRLCQ